MVVAVESSLAAVVVGAAVVVAAGCRGVPADGVLVLLVGAGGGDEAEAEARGEPPCAPSMMWLRRSHRVSPWVLFLLPFRRIVVW